MRRHITTILLFTSIGLIAFFFIILYILTSSMFGNYQHIPFPQLMFQWIVLGIILLAIIVLLLLYVLMSVFEKEESKEKLSLLVRR